MCGIAGYLDSNLTEGDGVALIKVMNESIKHRGPDGSGYWIDGKNGVGLGHTRLSIVGLGENGDQPMISSLGRYVITFNGEIYNFRALKSDLIDSGWHFRGGSDTEVLLACLEQWGLDQTLKKLIGMFAFALFDRELEEITLVRDRLGEKPLYISEREDGHVAFSSDLRTLLYLVKPIEDINRSALQKLLSLNCIPSPETIVSGISKLEPAYLWRFRREDKGWRNVSKRQWWQYETSRVVNLGKPAIPRTQATSKLIAILEEVIYEQGCADVPVGCFLSGGIDSTLVTAIHQRVSRNVVKTFTATFDEKDFDEGPHARRVADWLGTDHTEIHVSAEQAQEIIISMPQAFSEPFADSSQIATLAICRGAKSEVSAVLTGDGGDEVFGGYNRYIWAPRLWNIKTRYPKASSYVSRLIEEKLLSKTSKSFLRRLQKYAPIPQLGEKLSKIGWALNSSTKQEIYESLISNPALGKVVLGGSLGLTAYDRKYNLSNSGDFTLAMMNVDLKTYLPEDILVKVDRAAMSVGLETRVPLIDLRVIDFMAKLSKTLIIDNGQSKALLRDALDAYIPKKIMQRPKTGFAVPIGEWLREELRPWAGDLLSNDKLRSFGVFDADLVTEFWTDHLSGSRDCHRQLWPLLMFQSWLEHDITNSR